MSSSKASIIPHPDLPADHPARHTEAPVIPGWLLQLQSTTREPVDLVQELAYRRDNDKYVPATGEEAKHLNITGFPSLLDTLVRFIQRAVKRQINVEPSDNRTLVVCLCDGLELMFCNTAVCQLVESRNKFFDLDVTTIDVDMFDDIKYLLSHWRVYAIPTPQVERKQVQRVPLDIVLGLKALADSLGLTQVQAFNLCIAKSLSGQDRAIGATHAQRTAEMVLTFDKQIDRRNAITQRLLDLPSSWAAR